MKKLFLILFCLSGLVYSQAQVIFVVRANGDDGLHFPHYAFERGENLKDIQLHPNKKGSNFNVQITENIKGDYGAYREAGKLVFYVRNAWLAKYIDVYQLDIKYEATKWQPKKMQKIGDFWVYRE